ncbi:hypothetical protein HAX54_038354 [Datura stramonium]|uniref:Uncharacterized protein n=1 Tax=Datura stramonium TaxID=4076 RepID=A0ABS8SI89_DATST|nr:hypothetical protein [Datura stramonium]
MIREENNRTGVVPPPGRSLFLNRLASETPNFSEDPNAVSLPELLYPIENLEQLFIATFTADIPWFLSYCEIPADLPVTIACHNAERCWSSNPDKRSSTPCSFRTLLSCGLTFPLLSIPLLCQMVMLSGPCARNDFAAQLAGFMAPLVADVPSQAHWILELTNYDFRGSAGYLVASVPGVHSSRIPCVSKPKHFLGGDCLPELLDLNGARLKKLASYLGKCGEDVYGMSEVILKRDSNIPADANAVSILVPNPEDLSLGGKKIHIEVRTLQGPSFSAISEIIRAEHVSAICSLIASLQRCWGIWRLQEGGVQLKHGTLHMIAASLKISLFLFQASSNGEHLETDFVFVHPQLGPSMQIFSCIFSSSWKRSSRFFESEESDQIGAAGVKLGMVENYGHLHDAVPYPGDRIGNPMHVKVARRRFQLRKDASSFGWVYCGSHNFSEAAWGRPVSGLLDKKINGNKSYSNLGSRLHISNYELGILFITPPPDAEGKKNQRTNLDDIVLPFVMPAPKYRPADKPATPQEMREALMEQMECRRDVCEAAKEADEWMQEEIPEEEEVIEATDFVVKEKR